MRKRIVTVVGIVATVVGALAFTTTPASAATGVLVLAGGGTYSPGMLLSSPSPQTFTYAGTGALVTTTQTTTVHGIESCSWSGSTSSDTALGGTGTFDGSCSGTVTTVISGTYIRSNVAELTFTASAPGLASGTLTGVCAFVPTTAPSVTSYELDCTISIP